MGKLEIVGTNYYSNGSFEYNEFTPKLNKDLNELINDLPAGAKVGIECSREIIENPDDRQTDAVESSIPQSVRNKFFEQIINKCNEKNIDVVYLLDDVLCEKGKEILKYWDIFGNIGESLELGYSPQTDFEVETKNGEKIIKNYHELDCVAENNFNYWKFVLLPDSIFQKVNEGDFDLVVLSRKTLGYFARQRPSLMDYSKIDVRVVILEELDSEEEVIRKENGVVVENKTFRKSKLVSYELNNYPEKNIKVHFGYRPGDREKIIAKYLTTSDIVIRI